MQAGGAIAVMRNTKIVVVEILAEHAASQARQRADNEHETLGIEYAGHGFAPRCSGYKLVVSACKNSIGEGAGRCELSSFRNCQEAA
jgi:hypothetical protein